MATGPIAILGAGIGGLALALALRRRGFGVQVYEQAAQLGEVGAGLSLSPNAVKGLHELGLAPTLEQLADEPPVQRTCHYRTGATLLEFDRSDTRDRYGAPYYQMHRADLHSLLHQRLQELGGEIQIATGHALEDAWLADGGVLLQFSSGARVGVRALVAADGWRSRVRASIFGVQPPRFSGYVAFRGIVPVERLEGLALAPGSSVSIGPGRLFVHYPIRRGRELNFVAFARSASEREESWSQRSSVEEVAALLHDFHAQVHRILAATPGGHCNTWGLYAREPLPRWVRGAVALLGDAAHPMMPWFGQGAAAAIEDAIVLARALQASASIEEGFERYEHARLARVTMIYRESLLGGERLAGTEPELLSPQTVRNEDTLGLFSYDPVTVPV